MECGVAIFSGHSVHYPRPAGAASVGDGLEDSRWETIRGASLCGNLALGFNFRKTVLSDK